MALWTLGTVLWLLVPRNTSNQLVTRAKTSLHGLERGMGQVATSNPAAANQAAGDETRAASNPARVTPSDMSASGSAPAARAPGQSAPELRSVFRTSAQQLYDDFNANVVAIQTRIGSSRVRVTGTVGEIDQDADGHPVVKLRTGKDSDAAMSLTEDQRAAAAQLVKDEAVEIECDKVGHSGEVLQGSGCTLAMVDSQPKQVNLALFVANDNGTSGVYVVGPMSEADCFAQGDGMTPRMHVNQQGEYVVWRGCTNAARESIAPEGCRLNASPVTIQGMGSAHLWRYDCGSPSAVHTSVHKRNSASSHQPKPAALPPSEADESQDPAAAKAFAVTMPVAKAGEATAAPVDVAPGPVIPGPVAPAPVASAPGASSPVTSAGGASAPGVPAPVSPPASGSSSASGPTTSGSVAPGAVAAGAAAGAVAAGAAGAAGSTAPVATPAEVARAQTSDLHLASASQSDVGGPATGGGHAPMEEATVAHAPPSQPSATPHTDSQGSAVPNPNATPDDLAQVRTVDPQAAEHIATYCDKTIASANRDSLITECRHSEAEAWTRLVLKNEFPSLDDATRRKCSEPPFPDTYVAKESCARYELHLN